LSTVLPPVDGAVLAEILDALPPRLRKRLDATAQRAAEWKLDQGDPEPAADGKPPAQVVLARVDEETTVTLRVRNGAIRSADDVHCDCLLAPACLHRAALTGLAPPLDADAEQPAAEPSISPSPPPSPPSPASPVDAERSAAQALWDTGSALLVGGMIGASLFNEAQMRRAAHQARALGLYRAATLGTRIAAGLRAARERRDDYSLPQLTADLRDLLLNARSLLRAADSADHLNPTELAELRGSARRSYDHHGGLRLYGLFSEPVIASSGHSGIVTYLVDETGTLWTTANVMPGDADRVRPAYNTAAGVGGTVLTHRELTRGGLIVSGASASADGRLSSGSSTRAVKAAGATWDSPPIAALFDHSLEKQIERAFAAADREGPEGLDRAGADLVFLRLRVLGPTEHGFAAAAESGESVYCVPPQAGHDLPYRGNLEVLASQGLDIRVIARLDRHRPATLHLLAASPSDQTSVALPPEWAGRINLGLDSLTPANVRRTATDLAADLAADLDAPPSNGTPLHLLRHRIEQAVAGGRVVTAAAAADREAARLRRSSLHTAGDLLAGLVAAAPTRRDAFGRPLSHRDYLEAWLAAAHYEAVASQRFLLRRWFRT
jgi:hypothetical protein